MATYFRFSSAFSRRAVVSYWRKYVREVLVNRLGDLSLPRKSVVRLTDRPDMTSDVKQQCNNNNNNAPSCKYLGCCLDCTKAQDDLKLYGKFRIATILSFQNFPDFSLSFSLTFYSFSIPFLRIRNLILLFFLQC